MKAKTKKNMKNAQTEVMGLAIISIIAILGILFASKF